MNTAANTTTKETTPWHIWFDAVQAVAREKREISPENVALAKARMLRAYQAGEPVWMAAHELALREGGLRLAKIAADDGRSEIRAAHRASLGLK